MLAVLIPVHNEAEHLPATLAAVASAAVDPGLRGEPVQVVVALDGCTDGSAEIARDAGALTVATPGGRVGVARAAAAQLALQHGARWLACTDADTQPETGWLRAQLQLHDEAGFDAVCGTVAVRDWQRHWGPLARVLQQQHDSSYEDRDGHRHIHGANLGVSAPAYARCGGFQPLASSEDVALVGALLSAGARISWSSAPRVLTSARRRFRAPAGFGALLQRLESQALQVVPGADGR